MDRAAVLAAVTARLRAVPRGAVVVLAVSGGPDSTGMAHLVPLARPDLDAAVVHIRHGLRDDRADATAASAHAEALGLACHVVSVEVHPTGTGPEDAARRARLQALGATARRLGAGFVCVGHTADDHAETVLLNLARGAGLQGLAGIPAVRALAADLWLVRPLLDLRRSTVREVATATGLPVVHDPANREESPRRNRARHDLLPGLAALTGGDTDPVAALARAARHARRDGAALDTIAEAEAARSVRRWGPVRTVPAAHLAALPVAVASRVVQRLLADGGASPPETAVDALLALRDGQAATLAGGWLASRGGGLVAVVAGGAAAGLPRRSLEGDRLPLPELGLAVRRDPAGGAGALPPWAPRRAAVTVATGEDQPLVIRSRRPGDRIAGAGGTRTVAAAMADAGVPRVARNLVPVVEDDSGVLWVPGVAVRAGAAGSRALRLQPLGGK